MVPRGAVMESLESMREVDGMVQRVEHSLDSVEVSEAVRRLDDT